LYNAWDAVGKQDAAMNEIVVFGVPFTHEDFERMASEGLNQQFFKDLKKDGLNAKRVQTLLKVMATDKKVTWLYFNVLMTIRHELICVN